MVNTTNYAFSFEVILKCIFLIMLCQVLATSLNTIHVRDFRANVIITCTYSIGLAIVSLKATFGLPEITGQLYSVFIL